MKLKFAALLLVVSAGAQAASLELAPVRLNIEGLEWYTNINDGDNFFGRFSEFTARTCLSVDPPPMPSCLYHRPTFERDFEGAFFDPGGANPVVLYGPAAVGTQYASSVSSSSTMFYFEANSFVFAESATPLPADGFVIEKVVAYAGMSKYFLEFEVFQPVLYEGSVLLTDGLYEFDTNAFPFGDRGEIFESGDVLAPGVYQYWAGSIGPGDPNTLNVPGLPSTSILFPELGQSLYEEVSQDFQLRFTVVPIPAAVWLFGSALFGLGWLRRR